MKIRDTALRRLLGKLVCVAWEDAACASNWETRTEIVSLGAAETVGWLTGFDGKVINLAQSRGDEHTTTEVMAIPRSNLIKLRRLKPG